MKRVVSLILLVCLVCCAVSSYAESEHKTPFDTYSQWRGYETISKPVYPQYLSAGELDGNHEEILQFLARAWYNMLAHETKVKGTSIQKTMAADIYRGLKKGPAIAAFTAPDKDAVCMNALFAVGGCAYWIEVNTETQTVRYFQQYGVDKQKDDGGYLHDYVFNSLLAASMGGNVLSSVPGSSVSAAYGTKSNIYKTFDAAYKTATGENNPIK